MSATRFPAPGKAPRFLLQAYTYGASSHSPQQGRDAILHTISHHLLPTQRDLHMRRLNMHMYTCTHACTAVKPPLVAPWPSATDRAASAQQPV